MKKIGIIGGLGPMATTDYYKEIIKCFNDRNALTNLDNPALEYPEIIIYSVNMGKFIGFIQQIKYPEAIEYISDCINKLADAGSDFAAISANTPHMLFKEIQEKSRIPLISIVESTLKEAQILNLKRIGLIGTKFTMMATFFQDAFKPYGIEIYMPPAEDIEIIHEKLFSELELGIFKPITQVILLDIIQKMIYRDRIDSLILGCTEFPCMFTNSEYLGIPFINTTRIHVTNIVNKCLDIH